jgi:hypothetical protein
MTRAGRIKRLKELIAEIELLPASPERDRLLSEFRSRAVDVDTGVAPRAMLPMAEPVPAPVRAGRRPRMEPPAPAAPLASGPAAPAAADSGDEPFWVAEWLSLDDPTPPPVRARGGRDVPPWTLGLRG